MKTLLTALALTVLPGLAFAMGCAGYDHTTTAQMSCADGTVYDADTRACVPVASS
ncbi:MAG: adenylosuccinate lyase [Paracoccaceae bacterium]|nr:adenylosuccinate lyase [Paracoccaceae bacterium]